MKPSDMPQVGTPLTLVKRFRDVPCGDGCCCNERVEFVPALKRGPRPIRNTALADALVAAGLR